jgi:UDP-glucose 4-epimerase
MKNTNSLGHCLVTGGTGYIGSRLIKHLISCGNPVRTLSRRIIPNTETILCDFEKEEIPANTLDSIDTVFHLAGLSKDIGNNRKLEGLYKKINVDISVCLGKYAMIYNVKHFVYVSSVKAAGEIITKQDCLTEEDVGELTGIYSRTKREAEVSLMNLSKNSDMHLSILRPSMVYGPNVGGNIGSMLSGVEKGWFPPLPEIENRKSMIHVSDLIRALLFLASNNDTNGEIFIATDGLNYSSRDMYNIYCDLLNKTPPSWSVPEFVFKMLSLVSMSLKNKVNKIIGSECYSSEKLRHLGFEPKLSLQDINKDYYIECD